MNTNALEVITKFGEKVDGYISALAGKAGMAVEHFWPVVVQQQIIDGWWGIIMFVINLIVLAISVLVFYKSCPDSREESSINQVAGMIIGAVCGFLCFVALFCNTSELGTNVSKIRNPEYYAIQKVIYMVK